MAIDPRLLAQALRTPANRDPTESPIVRAVILTDPANAADIVPALGRRDPLEARNARYILCEFGPLAVPHVLAALAGAPAGARAQGIEVVWALLTGERAWVVAEAFDAAAADLDMLLRDRGPLPDEMPAHVERDFRGRVCDLAYVVVEQLLDPRFDQSTFRALDDDGRDEAIRRRRARGFGRAIS